MHGYHLRRCIRQPDIGGVDLSEPGSYSLLLHFDVVWHHTRIVSKGHIYNNSTCNDTINDIMIGRVVVFERILCSVILRIGAPKTSHSDSSTCSLCLGIQPVSDAVNRSSQQSATSTVHIARFSCHIRIVPKEIYKKNRYTIDMAIE